jgi:hypothetical protein
MQCPECANEIPDASDRCPHCGRPGLFPNVRVVQQPPERDALHQRYRNVMQDAVVRGVDGIVRTFEAKVEASEAVIARTLGEVQRLASSDKQGYASYYQLVHAQVRLPDGDVWDALRRPTDEVLFPGYKEHIRFAALTIDGVGLANYGDCSVVLRTSMIEHRSTVLEENSVMFMKRRGITIADAAVSIRGHRASWAERGMLAVAKHESEMNATTSEDSFARMVLEQGKTSEDDRFIEVYIYGSMTARTIDRVVYTARGKRRASRSTLKALKEQLGKFGGELNEKGAA